MKLSIMSWNCALTEKNYNDRNKKIYSSEGEYMNRYKKIFSYVKTYMENRNAIVFLQEIPFKDPTSKDPKGNWKEHNTYEELNNIFDKENYDIYSNKDYNGGYIIMMTVAISNIKNGVVKEGKEGNYLYPNENPTNREIGVSLIDDNKKTKLLSILGLHAKNGNENNGYLQSINGNADIIVGDFNAGNYPESENAFTYRSILKDHVSICEVPTKEATTRKTCIDHIFIKRSIITKSSNINVDSNTRLSDHYPISFDIDIDL